MAGRARDVLESRMNIQRHLNVAFNAGLVVLAFDEIALICANRKYIHFMIDAQACDELIGLHSVPWRRNTSPINCSKGKPEGPSSRIALLR